MNQEIEKSRQDLRIEDKVQHERKEAVRRKKLDLRLKTQKLDRSSTKKQKSDYDWQTWQRLVDRKGWASKRPLYKSNYTA